MTYRYLVAWRAVLSRTVLFALIWWVLVGGNHQAWLVGAPAVLLTVLTSFALLAPAPLAWYRLLRFIPFFLRRSLQGGVDVAWRAFHRRLPIEPVLIEYPLRLPQGLPRVMLVNIISLLPGTLSADLEARRLRVHVLSGSASVMSDLKTLEQRVARLCNVSLAAQGADESDQRGGVKQG